jgi:hypothetical protein
MQEMRDTYNVPVAKPKGKIPLERRRCRWEDNIKMNKYCVEMWT